jgi:hypothetical protein
MTSAPLQTPPSPSPSLGKALLRDKHFLIASAILAVTAAGWGAATQWLQLTTLKNPVPWPAGVTVNQGFRFQSLRESKGLDELGPLKILHPFDEQIRGLRALEQDPNFSPDELIRRQRGLERLREDPNFNPEIFKKTDLETLKIGTVVDEERYADRKSNWYMVRYYGDTRPQAPVRAWRLEVYYYTGEADTVAHIPDTCGQASGASILSSDTVRWDVPQAPAPWTKTVPFHRTRFQLPDGGHSVTYYTFSMNGLFSDSSTWVRWELLWPFMRYGYFAKIQFSPAVGSSQPEETDRAAEEFMRLALPEVLKTLPSSQDVKGLAQGK